MSRINLILYATDFSEGAAEAASLAQELASAHSARLHLLHVITGLDDRHRRGIPASVVDAFTKEVKTQAMTDLHDFKERQFGGFQGELTSELSQGHGADEILARAAALKADLIVLGTHGRRGVRKLLLGSTAERVIRQSTVPVLTVPERD
ncbi:universal stress protein [Oceanimonas doudoroffii]|uniref:Universal stress protein UspA n=1 Tax=Oceanimonas doudoroffii TaxID=84158 RepID=A0A233RC91_9GAMM|nr:universal stress protein [Oceanimonas doudoroffii]OXY81005.1 universal stress protein UspA [Oceanimonas doudoroffii]